MGDLPGSPGVAPFFLVLGRVTHFLDPLFSDPILGPIFRARLLRPNFGTHFLSPLLGPIFGPDFQIPLLEPDFLGPNSWTLFWNRLLDFPKVEKILKMESFLIKMLVSFSNIIWSPILGPVFGPGF